MTPAPGIPRDRRHLPRRLLLGTVFFLLGPALLPAAEAAAPGPAKDRILVLLTIDGFPAAAFDDPRLPVPTLHRLAREGAVARRVTGVNPTVTWPSHASIVTGLPPAKHGVLHNGRIAREEPRGPMRVQHGTRAELLRAPTVYDLAHAAGLTTAHVNWIPHQTGGTIDRGFPERPDPRGAFERELIADGVFPEKDLAEYMKSTIVWRDASWTRAALHLLKKHKPNLLLVHLLALDSISHRHGPTTVAASGAHALADTRVRDLLDALREAGLEKRATVLVMSDHGFKPVRRIIRPNILLRRAGWIREEGGKTVCDAYAVPRQGTCAFFATAPEGRKSLLARLETLLGEAEGIARVLDPAAAVAAGFPDPAVHAEAGDRLALAKAGYGFLWGDDGDPVVEARVGETPLGMHGYPADDPDMDAFLIAWGAGIRPGARVERIRLVDVAPTAAALLGLRMQDVDGRVVTELLEDKP